MKQVAKTNKISLNDLFVSILSNSVYEYFEKYNHEAPDKARLD